MSAYAVKDCYLTPVLESESTFGPVAGATEGRWSGDDKRETEAPQVGVRSGRPHPHADRDNLEPHWLAAIDAATD